MKIRTWLIVTMVGWTFAALSAPARAEEGPAAKGTANAAVSVEKIAADTPRTTVRGNTFVAPAGWSLSVRGAATILETPEGDSRIALVDVEAADVGAAVARAWAELGGGEMKRPLKITTDAPDKDGWSKIRNFGYETSPNEKRDVGAQTRFANGFWTVILIDFSEANEEKRGAQIGILVSRLLPKGRQRESFAGKTANPLDAARIARLAEFIETARTLTGVPGVAFGIVQDGTVVYAGGSGARDLARPEKVDADTKFLIASNTKAFTTLMLAKLVDEKKLTWETHATDLLPSFKLGDAATTSQVLVKHLICACTGLPRQDMEWLFQFDGMTPASSLATLATMQPTTKFGELFQYSNPLASAAGYIGGHVAYPDLELGKAYDEAMRTRVFEPLAMTSTTFDYAKGHQGNFASAHAIDVNGKTARAVEEINAAILPMRPAGGAWSTVRDLLKYVQMEIDNGKIGDAAYITADTLLARRTPSVALNNDATYGMGLMTDKTYGVTVLHHGGDLLGAHSDMLWLPESRVGAVVLTNGDPGWLIRSLFQRKLLEVLFDGNPEADAQMKAAAKTYFEVLATQRKDLTIPARAADVKKLAARYTNGALGEIAVSRPEKDTVFDFGEWKSEMASRKNPDGSISFLTTRPGISGVEFVVGAGPRKTLVLRDAQHEYVFEEKPVPPAR
jgi:CubicO group peptidase (beta-lactamase class C family)